MIKPIKKYKHGGRLPNRTYLGAEGGQNVSGKTVFEKAVELEKQGKSNEQIRQLTGWFRNPHDHFWRYEISDKDATIISENFNKISEIVNKSEMITQEKITLYSVQYGTDDWTETKGSLTPDLSDAEYYYKIIGSSDLDGKKGYKQLIKQENEYKFVYNLDEEETADDYPLSEYWNDDSVWSLVSEGEHEVEKSEEIDDVNKSSEELLSLVEQHYKKEYSGGYKYKNIPVYSDELDEDGEQVEVGCLQLRIANHSENVSNIDRFGSCDYYLSVVISNQDPTRGRFWQSMYERRRNEKEIYFDSGSDFDEVISEIDDEIEEAMNYVKDKNSATFKMGGEVTNNKETKMDKPKNNLALYTRVKGEKQFKVSDFKGNQVDRLANAPLVPANRFDEFLVAVKSTAEQNKEVDFRIKEFGTNKIWYDSQLSKGTEVELEHKDTIEEIASGKLTTEEGAEKIASDHIEEDKNYYDKLEKMEQEIDLNSIDDLINKYKISSTATKSLIENAIRNHNKIEAKRVFEFADIISKHDKEQMNIHHVAEAIQYEISRSENEKDAFTISLQDVFNVLIDGDMDYFVPANKERIHELGLSDKTYSERVGDLKEIKKSINNSQNEKIVRVSLENLKYYIEQNEYSFNEVFSAIKSASESTNDIKVLVEKLSILNSIITPKEIEDEEALEMTNEAPEKKQKTKDEKIMSNIGSDDWLKIPDSNKYIKKVVSKAFTYDPYDKEFQNITGLFTANDSLRYIMSAVDFSGNGICATNAHILLYMNHVSKKYSGAYCVSPSCLKTVPENEIKDDKIEGKYPNYVAVIPDSNPHVYTIDLLAVKTYCETIIRSRYTNQTINHVLFTYDNNRLIGFNGKFMIDLCEGLLKMGYHKAKIGLSEPNRGAVVVTDMSYDGTYSPVGKSDFALIMPIMTLKMVDSDVFDHKTIQGDPDFDIGGNLAYSFEEGAVITAGGNRIHKIDTTLTREKAKETSSVRLEIINIVSQVLKKNKAIPILDYVLVKDEGIEVTDLETHIRVTGINLPDGMYALNGDSLFPDKHEAEDYPFFPPKKDNFDKIGDINRQEFLFHFKRCLDFVGSDKLRPVMSGVHLSKEGGKLFIASTDAHALYRAEIEKFNIDGDLDVVIPNPKLVNKLLDVFDCDDIALFLNKEKNGLSMTCGDGAVYSRLIDGRYPNTKTVYPSSYNKIMKIKTADLKKILSEIKVEKKKAGVKTSEPFAAVFVPNEGKCQISHTEYSGSYNDRTIKGTVYKTIDVPMSIEHIDSAVETQDYPLMMPINIGDGSEYLQGAVIGLRDFNIDRIASLGYSDVEIGMSDPNRGIIILNKPVIFGTKETAMQKEKKAKKEQTTPLIDPMAKKTFEGKVPVEKITIHWAEGDNSKYDVFPKDYKTYEDANKAIIPVFEDVYKDSDGGYNKVKFTIFFADGEVYEGRLDVSEKEDNPTTTNNVIGRHVKLFLDYELSEKSKSDEMMKDRVRAWINKYDLGVDVSVSEKTDDLQQIKDAVEGLELLKKLTKNKTERRQYQDAIDGLKLLV